MKNERFLSQRFDSIRDPEITEETLGAYLEGNLDPVEMQLVAEAIAASPDLDFLAAAATDFADSTSAEIEALNNNYDIQADTDTCIIEAEPAGINADDDAVIEAFPADGNCIFPVDGTLSDPDADNLLFGSNDFDGTPHIDDSLTDIDPLI